LFREEKEEELPEVHFPKEFSLPYNQCPQRSVTMSLQLIVPGIHDYLVFPWD